MYGFDSFNSFQIFYEEARRVLPEIGETDYFKFDVPMETAIRGFVPTLHQAGETVAFIEHLAIRSHG